MSKAMLKSLVTVAALCVSLAFAGAADAAQAKAAKAPKQDRFEKCDTNKDGFLSKEEFKACSKRMKPENVDKRFAAVDTDKDGKISKAEWDATKAKRAERRAARVEKTAQEKKAAQ